MKRTVEIAPYGNKWFLPRYKFDAIMGAPKWSEGKDGSTIVDVKLTPASEIEDLTDYSIKARVRRWLYMRYLDIRWPFVKGRYADPR